MRHMVRSRVQKAVRISSASKRAAEIRSEAQEPLRGVQPIGGVTYVGGPTFICYGQSGVIEDVTHRAFFLPRLTVSPNAEAASQDPAE